MKSRIIVLRRLVRILRGLIRRVTGDQIAVYAAQASFFVIISSVPFLSMLLFLTGAVLPELAQPEKLAGMLPGMADAAGFITLIFADLQSTPAFSLLSVTALTTLWTASRGIGAIRYGMETIFEINHRSYVRHQFKSILATLAFMAILAASVVLLLFGDLLFSYFGSAASRIFGLLRTPLFLLLLTGYIVAVYVSIARRSRIVSASPLRHLPGAILSSVGWGLYSYLYSLYLRHFPGASRIQGSLGAVCLMMVWLYFCMAILLFGAEINKLWFAGVKKTGDIEEGGTRLP